MNRLNRKSFGPMRMNRKEYKLLVENWRQLINESESQLHPPSMMDFGNSDRMHPQRLAALSAAPRDFVEYDGSSKMFSSKEDFVKKMLNELQNMDLEYTASYGGHKEEELENAFNALFNGVLPQDDPYDMRKEGVALTKTGYTFNNLDSLREDLESGDPTLMKAIADLYSIAGNWSYYSIFEDVAFN